MEEGILGSPSYQLFDLVVFVWQTLSRLDQFCPSNADLVHERAYLNQG